MLQVCAIAGTLIFVAVITRVILLIMEAKNGEGLDYDWWDDEEKGQEQVRR